jgi:hypothetical protein
MWVILIMIALLLFPKARVGFPAEVGCYLDVLREKVSRGRITSRLANLPPCLILFYVYENVQ